MLPLHEDNHSINYTMSRKKEQPVIENVLITDVGAEGKAVAHIDGMVVFVPFVVPGDIVDVKILKKKKKYAEGRAVNVKHYSDKRATPQCPHFGTCGGCRWQNLLYDQQLAAKQQQVRDAVFIKHFFCNLFYFHFAILSSRIAVRSAKSSGTSSPTC